MEAESRTRIMNTTPYKLTLEFPNKEAALEYASWMCGSGEQAYWQWTDICGHCCENINYNHKERAASDNDISGPPIQFTD